ncbi:MAG: hypothetical protein M3068_00895 [Gemmatimonadota bacterium]|nr:hypothetical protein [Gemmatimonadota bacterium]
MRSIDSKDRPVILLRACAATVAPGCGGWRPRLVTRGSSLVGSAAILLALTFPRTGAAQTDFYNTDRGRPVQIEDAYVTERYAFELKLAPVRVERAPGGTYNWGLEPEMALGIFARTQVEVGLPLAFVEQGAQRRSGVAGLDVSAMHNFNVETEGLPAFAVRADFLAPVGNLKQDRLYSSLTGIATRTYRWARIHVNGQYTFGAAPSATDNSTGGGAPVALGGPGATSVSRWLAGAAIDRSFPFRSTLITAEFYGRKPLVSSEEVEYTLGTGTRFQVSPTLALDGGFGRRLNGPERGWYVTFGSAYAFAVRSLLPGGR